MPRVAWSLNPSSHAPVERRDDTSLPQALGSLAPICAQSCIDSFIQSAFVPALCSSSNDITCLCSHYTSSGYTLGEIALACLDTACSSPSSTTSAANLYHICANQQGAANPTHTVLTLTTATPADGSSSSGSGSDLTMLPTVLAPTATPAFTFSAGGNTTISSSNGTSKSRSGLSTSGKVAIPTVILIIFGCILAYWLFRRRKDKPKTRKASIELDEQELREEQPSATDSHSTLVEPYSMNAAKYSGSAPDRPISLYRVRNPTEGDQMVSSVDSEDEKTVIGKDDAEEDYPAEPKHMQPYVTSTTPGPSPTPNSAAIPTPQSIATPTPNSAAIPTPQSMATPTPNSAAISTPQSMATPTPKPLAVRKPKPIATIRDLRKRHEKAAPWKRSPIDEEISISPCDEKMSPQLRSPVSAIGGDFRSLPSQGGARPSPMKQPARFMATEYTSSPAKSDISALFSPTTKETLTPRPLSFAKSLGGLTAQASADPMPKKPIEAFKSSASLDDDGASTVSGSRSTTSSRSSSKKETSSRSSSRKKESSSSSRRKDNEDGVERKPSSSTRKKSISSSEASQDIKMMPKSSSSSKKRSDEKSSTTRSRSKSREGESREKRDRSKEDESRERRDRRKESDRKREGESRSRDKERDKEGGSRSRDKDKDGGSRSRDKRERSEDRGKSSSTKRSRSNRDFRDDRSETTMSEKSGRSGRSGKSRIRDDHSETGTALSTKSGPRTTWIARDPEEAKE